VERALPYVSGSEVPEACLVLKFSNSWTNKFYLQNLKIVKKILANWSWGNSFLQPKGCCVPTKAWFCWISQLTGGPGSPGAPRSDPRASPGSP
jgi:hypothetical protein